LRHVGCRWLKFDHFQTWANNTQHVTTPRNTVAKRTQHVAPNNVAICCVDMLRSFVSQQMKCCSMLTWLTMHLLRTSMNKYQNWKLYIYESGGSRGGAQGTPPPKGRKFFSIAGHLFISGSGLVGPHLTSVSGSATVWNSQVLFIVPSVAGSLVC